jgi:hypothetical protein
MRKEFTAQALGNADLERLRQKIKHTASIALAAASHPNAAYYEFDGEDESGGLVSQLNEAFTQSADMLVAVGRLDRIYAQDGESDDYKRSLKTLQEAARETEVQTSELIKGIGGVIAERQPG